MLAKKRLLACALLSPACIAPSRPAVGTSPVTAITTPPSRQPPRRHYGRHLPTTARSPEPYPWPLDPNPSPYQILNCAKGSPYSKQKYYHLVKLYHPDTPPISSTATLPEVIRLERFRLIVAAHELLSDPLKKRAYDRYGAGWGGHTNVKGRKEWQCGRDHQQSPPGREGDMSWTATGRRSWWDIDWSAREGHPDPHNNATWEDWERYHELFRKASYEGGVHQGPDQKPLYTSNSKFIVMVVILSAVGGLASVNQAQKSSQTYLAERDRQHDQISKDLRKTRQEAVQLGNREEQVRKFLRNRDPGWEGHGHFPVVREGKQQLSLPPSVPPPLSGRGNEQGSFNADATG